MVCRCTSDRQSVSPPCPRCLRLLQEVAQFEDALLAHPVPAIASLFGSLDHLANLERERKVDWLGNHVGRLRTLLAVGEYAEATRKLRYGRDLSNAESALSAQLLRERVVPEYERLLEGGRSKKEISVELGKPEFERLQATQGPVPPAWKKDGAVPSLSKDRMSKLKKQAEAAARKGARLRRKG